MKKNISIIYYDESFPKEQLEHVCSQVRKALGEDGRILVLPKNFDVLLDCSLDQLLQVRAMIDTTIEMKCEMKDESSECEEFLTSTSGVH